MLDTNLLIHVMRDSSATAVRKMQAHGGHLVVSSISVAELDFGVEHSTDPVAMRADLESMLTLVDVAPFDRPAARESGAIRQMLGAAGTLIGPYDLLIAGHARALKLTLVTHNTREFSRVPGLRLADWES